MNSYRPILEVAKWLAPQEALLSGPLVSSIWLKAFDSSELWDLYLDCAQLSSTAYQPSKDAYRAGHHVLGLISPTTLFLFDPHQRSWRQVELSTKIESIRTASWALTSVGAFICTGGCVGAGFDNEPGQVLRSACCIYQSGIVTALPSMVNGRKRHGTIALKGHCYVFGGNNGHRGVTVTEKLRLEEGENWGKMADMGSPRYSFNPCEYNGMVYLAGGVTSNCELFNPSTDTFTPIQPILKVEYSSAIVLNGDLAVLTPSRVYSEKEEWQWKEKARSAAYGNMNPVVRHGICFIAEAYLEFCVVEVDMSTGKLSRNAPPSSQA